jgi:hypothetical protein
LLRCRTRKKRFCGNRKSPANVPVSFSATMTFLYDLGDRWRFECTLDTVGADEEAVDALAVMDVEGDPPEQYSGVDGWW